MLLIEPLAFAVGLQTGAVDQKVQWLIRVEPFGQDCQTTTTATERGVIGDGDINIEHLDDRPQQTLSLTQRLMKHQAERQAGLDGDR